MTDTGPSSSLAGVRTSTDGPKRVKTNEVTFEEYEKLIAQREKEVGGVIQHRLQKEDFERLAQGPEVQDFRSRAQETNATADRFQAAKQQREQVTASRQAGEERFSKFQQDFESLGQNPEAAIDFQNFANTAMALLSLEGDTEEEAQARQTAAVIFHDYQKQLAPHIEGMDGGQEWWERNYEKINAELDAAEPGIFRKGLEALLQSDVAGNLFQLLEQTEQGALGAVKGVSTAIAGNDEVSRGDALKFAGNSLARGVGGLAEGLVTGLAPGADFSTDRFGLDGSPLLTTSDGRVLSSDIDGDGVLNLREALGRDPEAGGRLLGLVDTVGIAALDPLSWVSLGQSGRTKAAVNTLRQSGDDVSRRVAVQLENGLKYADLDDVSRQAMQSSFLRSAGQAVASMSDNAVVRQQYKNPTQWAQKAFKEADGIDKMRARLVDQRAAQMDAAVQRGVMPGLRVGGTTVVPMKRLYSALGVLDTSLADGASWSRQLLATADLETTDELLNFIQRYGGGEMPADLQAQVRDWSVITSRMADEDDLSWLDDILQRAEDTDTVMDQVEAFGKELFDDREVSSWRQFYTERFTRQTTGLDTVQPQIDNLTGQIREPVQAAIESGKAEGIGRAVKSLNTNDLSLEAQRRVQRNLDVFEKPHEWVLKDLKPRGIRSLSAREDMVGRLLRRLDAFSPRAAVRRGKATDSGTADQLDNAMTIAAAKRDLLNDHMDRLGMTRTGESKLAVAAAEEVDGDVWEVATRFLTENEDNIPGIVRQLESNDMENMAKLVNSLQGIRQDIFDISVSAGADEAALLGMKGYLPRVFTEEARKAAAKALRTENVGEIDAFEKLGLISDGAVTGSQKNPLGQSGALKGRTYQRDLNDLYEVNRAAQRDLAESGIDGADGFKLYEDNPARALLLRSRQAHDAMVFSTMLDETAKIKDLAGRPLAYVAKTAADVDDAVFRQASDAASFGKGDYVVRDFPGGGKYMVNRTIMNEIENTRRIMGAPDTNAVMKKFMTRWNNIWGAYATVPLVGMGFHARNATGNIFNMMLAGATNPMVLRDAAFQQQNMKKVRKIMREDGVDFAEAASRSNLDEGSIELLRNARKFDILDSGQTADIFEEFDPLSGKSTINPLNQNNAVVASGRGLGTAIENNARMGLFIDGINKGMAPEQAAGRVRAHLFDYQDLTAFESDNIRMLSRFYTFMRKNTALQARVMMTQPGQISNANRAMGEFTDWTFGLAGVLGIADGPGSGTEVTPGQDLGGGAKVPDWASHTMRLYGRSTLVGIDTPFAAAGEMANNLNALVKTPAALALMLAAEPGSESAKAREEFEDQLRNGLQMFSGGPVEGVKTVFEFESGRDMFTGGELNNVDRNWVDTLTRMTDAVFPVGGKLDRELEYFGAYDKLGVLQDDDKASRAQGSLRLMNALLGFQVMTGLDSQETIDRNVLFTRLEIDEALDQARFALEGSGIDVPTIDDLVEAGELVRRNRVTEYLMYHTVSGTPLTPEQREQIERLVPGSIRDAAGLDVAEAEKSEWSAQERAARVREMASGLQALGVEVTDDMIDSLVLKESGIRFADADRLGIEAAFRSNPFEEGGEEESEEARRERSDAQIAELAELLGTDVDGLRERRPLLQPFERKAAQMREAGLTDSEIIAELTDTLSRQEKAMLFGEDSLEKEFTDEPLTAEEQMQLQRRAAAAQAELEVMTLMVAGRMPSQGEVDEWMSEVMLKAPEQRALGFENFTPDSRKNVTSDETKQEIFEQRVTAVQDGSDFLTQLGQEG